MKIGYPLLLLGLISAFVLPSAPSEAVADTTVTATFAATGGEQSWTVPAGVKKVHVIAVGARGGDGADGGDGSGPDGRPGERIEADLVIGAGMGVLFVEVGQQGGNGESGPGGSPGFGGGNSGGSGAPFGGGAGGGASDIRACPIGAPCDSLGSRLLVGAGGGGGGGRCFGITCVATGEGGDGSESEGGGSGIPTGPGGVPGSPGGLGVGGVGGIAVPGGSGGGGAGGGGGWYGGGGGASGYLSPLPPFIGIDGGHGGRGSSHAGPGTSNVAVSEAGEDPRVTISYLVEATSLAYTGATQGPIGSPATLKARLTAVTTGLPVAGATAKFELGPLSCGGLTDSDGVASCQVTPPGPAGVFPLQVSYAGDVVHHPSTVETTFEVTRKATTVTYISPAAGDYHDPATLKASLTLTLGGAPVSGQELVFILNGNGKCAGITGADGIATCVLIPGEPAGKYPMVVSFAGDPVHLPSQAETVFEVRKEQTALSYQGDANVANGEPARLSARLVEDDGTPIAGRKVTFTLGAALSCAGQSDVEGVARCETAPVDEELNAAATVPVLAVFAGDLYYEPSQTTKMLGLQHMTGRAYGIFGSVKLLGGGLINVPRTPDTGAVRTPDAGNVAPACVAKVPGLISADALCASVVTTIAPGSSTASSKVDQVSVGVPGLPVIVVKNVTAMSVSNCKTATGSVTVSSISVGGVPLTISTGPNTTVAIPGLPGAKIVINEQVKVPGGLAVTGVHIIVPGALTSVDVAIAAATSDIHHCR